MIATAREYLLLRGTPPLGPSHVLPVPLNDPAYPKATWYPLADSKNRLQRRIGCQRFVTGRHVHDGNPRGTQDMRAARQAGYDLFLTYRALGFDRAVDKSLANDDGYFAGTGMNPWWGEDVIPELAAFAQTIGLKLVLSCGHKNNSQPERLEWEGRWMRAVERWGLSQVIHAVIGDNEGFQNSDFGYNDPRQFETYRQIQALMQATMHPCPLFACGAPASEATDEMLKVAQPYTQFVSVHVDRTEEASTRHTFNCVYDDNQWRIHQHYSFDEPIPLAPPSDQDFSPTYNPGRQFGTLAMSSMVAGTVVYFDGDDVFCRYSIGRAPTFWTAPSMLKQIPPDVARAQRVPNAPIWWWRFPDGRLATVVDELWDPQDRVLTVPQGVTLGQWRAWGPFNGHLDGYGNGLYQRLHTENPGWGGALLIADPA